jgi:hypothetical protein
MVALDPDGNARGIIDFAAHEDAGGAHTDIWVVQGAAGSKAWPEWIGDAAYDFTVELDGPPGAKHIAALVHRKSGYRRERDAIEAAIDEAPVVGHHTVDLRAIVGGPGHPLTLDEDGRTESRPRSGSPDHLPLVGQEEDS